MSFDELKSTCETLRALLREATGRELISAISVDEPTKPQDELHLTRILVLRISFRSRSTSGASHSFIAEDIKSKCAPNGGRDF